MRLPVSLLVSALFLFTPAAASAQTSPPAVQPAPIDASNVLFVGTTEWMVTAGPAWGIVVFHSAEGHRYFLQTASWSRVLSDPKGPRFLRGQLQWVFEVVPIYAQHSPISTYGFGFTPLMWRWNFDAPHPRVLPFVELSGGGLWTRDAVPVQTTTSNFTAHTGGGVRVLFKTHQALVLSYRFHHISNGNRLEDNPGVNAHVLQFGWSLIR